MITDYDEFKRLLKESYPNTTEGVDGVLFLTMDSISISIVPVPSDPMDKIPGYSYEWNFYK